MATYVIGDIQGCFSSFKKLLAKIQFDQNRDRLWLTGDLVNRGPHSLDVLRWAKQHRHCLHTVLGNHDLHLIGRYYGLRPQKPRDTLLQILKAEDGPELIEWLRQQPLFHRESDKILVHGGLLPIWNENEAQAYADEAQQFLRSDAKTLSLLYKELNDNGLQWSQDVSPLKRAAATIKVLTLIRVCHKDGLHIDFGFTDEPGKTPTGYEPWFSLPHQRSQKTQVIFGHWSALGLHKSPTACGLDTGCVWGRQLTAYCLDTNDVTAVDCS